MGYGYFITPAACLGSNSQAFLNFGCRENTGTPTPQPASSMLTKNMSAGAAADSVIAAPLGIASSGRPSRAAVILERRQVGERTLSRLSLLTVRYDRRADVHFAFTVIACFSIFFRVLALWFWRPL